jgi:hypothetical protein
VRGDLAEKTGVALLQRKRSARVTAEKTGAALLQRERERRGAVAEKAE